MRQHLEKEGNPWREAGLRCPREVGQSSRHTGLKPLCPGLLCAEKQCVLALSLGPLALVFCYTWLKTSLMEQETLHRSGENRLLNNSETSHSIQ